MPLFGSAFPDPKGRPTADNHGAIIKFSIHLRRGEKASLPNEARIVGRLELASLNLMDYETPGAEIVRLRK
ncbi:MAG: hypothetical protein CMO26_13795 [Thiotrichales bacterium]|nr:hypothetical protein [Thiotrichales bacterium]